MSVSASALRKLALLSLSSEQMAGVLEVLADGAEADETRRALQRERTRKHRLKRDGNVTEALPKRDGNSDPCPDKEIPRTPKEITPNQDPTSLRSVGPTDESQKKKEARAGRLPAAWTLPIGWREWAIGEGMLAAEIERQAIRFRDFWIAKAGKDAAKQDWLATWRNWIRRALDDKPSLRLAPAPMTASHDTMAPVAFDSPAYKPLLTRYRHEHGGADPPMNGKSAMLPADWVQASNEAVRRLQQ